MLAAQSTAAAQARDDSFGDVQMPAISRALAMISVACPLSISSIALTTAIGQGVNPSIPRSARNELRIKVRFAHRRWRDIAFLAAFESRAAIARKTSVCWRVLMPSFCRNDETGHPMLPQTLVSRRD